MLHKHILKKLFPLSFEDDLFDAEMALQGDLLDATERKIKELLVELFPNSADATIDEWESRLNVKSNSGDSLTVRQNRVAAKFSETGSLTEAYFILVAEKMGFTITIEQLQPFRCGISGCGHELGIERVKFIWQVIIINKNEIAILELENRFNSLKPAESVIAFIDKT